MLTPALHQPMHQLPPKTATPPRYWSFCAIFQYMGPSDTKTGPNESTSYTMIVSELLNPFFTISVFFDSHHALATLCKLENPGNSAFLGIFGSKMVEIAHFGGHFLGQKMALNRAISVRI